MTTEITKLTPIEGGLTLLGDPKRMLKQAQEVADVLVEVVTKRELFQKIGKKQHLYIEAWQFLAHFYGITAKGVGVDPYIDEITGAAGFKATADAVLISTGQVISSASALCLNNEDNWNLRPKYEYQNGNRTQIGEVHVPSQQLASMAQTRAASKVLSNVLRFVVVLAGFESTPAEEMTGDEHDQRTEKQPGKDPQRKSETNGNAQKISDAQRSRIFGVAKSVNCPMNTITEIIKSFGFQIAAEITRDKYDALVKAVQDWQTPPPTAAKS